MDTLDAALKVFLALGGTSGIVAGAYVFIQKDKVKAEGKKLGIDGDVSISDRALEMYKLARAEAQEAKLTSEYCQQKVDALEDHIDALKAIMRLRAIEPPPFQFPSIVTWKETQPYGRRTSDLHG